MDVLTVKELAVYFKCSISSVRNLVRNKLIPFFRIGNKLCFDKKAIDNWVHTQEFKNTKKDI